MTRRSTQKRPVRLRAAPALRRAGLGAALCAALAGATLAGTASAQDAGASPTPEAAATVGGRTISAMAVDNVARQLEADGNPADRATILDELVDMEVLAQAAEEAGLDARPEIATALRLQRVQTLANAWLADAGERMEIDDDALREEYARQVAGLPEREFRASHVLLETEAAARDVVARLGAGEDFAATATASSIDTAPGGALGWVARGGIDGALIEALEGLEPGAVTADPVATDFGWHVLRLDEARTATPPDFSAVRPGLRELVLRRRLAERVRTLRERAEIEIP